MLFIASLAFSQQSANTKVDSLQKAAEKTRARNVYVELGGPGLIYSANFDSRFAKTRDGLGGRIGAGYLSEDRKSIFTVPVGLNYLSGKSKHYFEMGVGATFVSYKAEPSKTYYDPYSGTGTPSKTDEDFYGVKDDGVLGTMTLAYRLQPTPRGFSFRAQANTLFGDGRIFPFGGLSFGYTF
jgi:hypothetical protein